MTVSMAHAAAAVSVLKEKGGINSALKDVCRASGLDKKKLKVFRENILRGVASPKAEYFYKWTVAVSRLKRQAIGGKWR